MGPRDPTACANRARAGGGVGHTARAHSAWPEPGQKGGPPQTAVCAPIAQHAQEGGVELPKPEGGGGGTPRAASTTGAWREGEGGGPTPKEATGVPPEQRGHPAHVMQEQEGGRGGHSPARRRGGGAPPEQARTPFLRGLIQEMGGNPQDLRRPPPNARRIEGEGIRGEVKGGTVGGVGAPPPLGGRGEPEEQARSIVARIINLMPGGGPHSGQTVAITQRARHTRVARGRGGRYQRGGRGDRDMRGRGRG